MDEWFQINHARLKLASPVQYSTVEFNLISLITQWYTKLQK